MPASSSFLRVSSLSSSPLLRAGLSMTRTLTPRRRAATTARRSAGEEKTNIFTRSDFFAVPMASRIGLAESSGRTSSDRDDIPPPRLQGDAWGSGPVAFTGLDAMQLGVDSAESHQLVVPPLLRDPAALEDQDGVRIADGAQAVGDGDHGAPLHQAIQAFDDQPLRLRVQ